VILESLLPAGAAPLDVTTDEGRADLRGRYAPPAGEWLRLNLVAAVSGDAAGGDGTSDSLSNPVDRAVLAAVRDLADAVLVGAASVRTEGYRVPRSAALVVVTASGDLTGHRLDPERAERVVVVCPEAAVATVRAALGPAVAPLVTVVTLPHDGTGRLDPAAVVSLLRDRGLRSLVCEGGPTLAGQLLRDGLVDELCLTTSPVVVGSGLPALGRERFDASRLELVQLLRDADSALYARWTVRGGPATR